MDEIRDKILVTARKYRERCSEFLRELIAIPSPSRHEENIALAVRKEMLRLKYPQVEIDRFGNVIGRLGSGPTQIIFDAHLDTTQLGDRSTWRFDPYGGEIKSGKIFGHGATNNKAGLASIIYAGALMQELELLHECTVYIIGSIQATECEGLAYKALFEVERVYPHFVVLAMPTGMRLHRGQRGHAEMRITVKGPALAASESLKSSNCIYSIAKIINNIQHLNERLPQDPELGKASIAVTQVACESHDSAALAEAAEIIIDRRLLPSESPKRILTQLREACKSIKSKIEIVEYDLPSYKGLRLPLPKLFPSWSLPVEHPLLRAADETYKNLFKKKALIGNWALSTAGVYTMGSANVPTFGFGPGEESNATPTNDHVRIEDLERSMAFYAYLLPNLPATEPIQIPRKSR